MIRHIVFFKWKPSFSEEIRKKWLSGLEAMKGNIPGMVELIHGPDVLSTDKSWDYAIIADFETVDDLKVYNTHPMHEAIKPYSLPNVEDLAYVDLQINDVEAPI